MKTKSMIFSRTENKPRIYLKLDEHIIEQVSNYIYLGKISQMMPNAKQK